MPSVRASATEEGTESEVEPIARWLRFIGSLSWKKGNLDQSSYDAFLRAGSLGLHPDIAAQEVSSRIEGAGDIVRLSKLKNQIRRAYASPGLRRPKLVITNQDHDGRNMFRTNSKALPAKLIFSSRRSG